MEKIAAGIVLFNPNIHRLKLNIDSIINQVQKVFFLDNGSKNIEKIEQLLQCYSLEKIQLICWDINKGIASALNELSQKAISEGFDWLLTLDQDSVSAKETIAHYLKYTSLDNVGIICPCFYDARRKNEEVKKNQDSVREIDFCITSGSLTNLSVYKAVGGYDDWLFIGLVDNEYCYRLRAKGYKILEDQSVLLNHELGNLTASKYENFFLKLGDILCSENIKKLSYRREVSPMRLYYATRNMVYLNRKYSGKSNQVWSFRMIIKNSISSILRGNNKLKLLNSIFYGVLDGMKYKF